MILTRCIIFKLIRYTKSTNNTIINGPFNDDIDFDVIQLNHYKCKTRTRGRADIPGLPNEDIDEGFNSCYNDKQRLIYYHLHYHTMFIFVIQYSHLVDLL